MRRHQGRVDAQGNYRNIGRKAEGYFDILSDKPFAALVTAWHPKSQTIDVIVPVQYGNIELDEITVYGNFFESTGTILTPKIATTLDDDGYSTIQKPEQINPTSDEYVLNNHIEALIFKTNSGEYSTNSFRFLSADSQMLNNVKEGRKISRHDDGSFSVHDEDGNYQFKHASGLNVRVGDSDADIELDESFDEHLKNKADYAAGIKAYVEYPLGGKFGYDNNGLIFLSNPIGSVKEEVLDAMLDHHTATLGFIDDFLTVFIAHNHPCIVPTGTPLNAANAVSIQVDVQLEITGVATTKATLATIMS